MSQENVELVRRAYTAYAENGIEGVVAFYAADHVAYSVPEWPDDPEYHGRDGLRKLSGQWTENFEDFGFLVHELRDAGDTVVALCEMTGRIKGSGVPIRHSLGVGHTDFRDGLVGETRYFLAWREALEAAGPEE
jgi:ketosteroid isomerase-like protein